jgi:hypothetical protein
MRFRLYREFGALNSPPIFDAFEQGIKTLGHESTHDPDAIPVIWSVLWQGRMKSNQAIYEKCRLAGKPVVIIEVGNFHRGQTWRIGVNHINSLGLFGNDENLDLNRPDFLGVKLENFVKNRRPEILVAAQHQHSLQWEGQSTMAQWATTIVNNIRAHTNRNIIVRPHPRSPFSVNLPGIKVDRPQRVQNTYDDFNINYNFHCVVNHNSGPGVQAAINGVPVICDRSSLAHEISGKIQNIEDITLPDRDDWFLKLCHTEWTVNEIRSGIPLKRLEKYLSLSLTLQ